MNFLTNLYSEISFAVLALMITSADSNRFCFFGFIRDFFIRSLGAVGSAFP